MFFPFTPERSRCTRRPIDVAPSDQGYCGPFNFGSQAARKDVREESPLGGGQRHQDILEEVRPVTTAWEPVSSPALGSSFHLGGGRVDNLTGGLINRPAPSFTFMPGRTQYVEYVGGTSGRAQLMRPRRPGATFGRVGANSAALRAKGYPLARPSFSYACPPLFCAGRKNKKAEDPLNKKVLHQP